MLSAIYKYFILNVGMLRVVVPFVFQQGTLTEEEGSVQLTSLH
jgi:hypothetical protein